MRRQRSTTPTSSSGSTGRIVLYACTIFSLSILFLNFYFNGSLRNAFKKESLEALHGDLRPEAHRGGRKQEEIKLIRGKDEELNKKPASVVDDEDDQWEDDEDIDEEEER